MGGFFWVFGFLVFRILIFSAVLMVKRELLILNFRDRQTEDKTLYYDPSYAQGILFHYC